MTIPLERTSAIQRAGDFLYRLLDRKQTPRVPKEIRDEAYGILRHFPSNYHLVEMSRNSPDVLDEPRPGYGSPSPDQYCLVLSAEQAHVLVDACDLYSRIGIGQFSEIEKLSRHGQLARTGELISEADRQKAIWHLEEAKKILTGLDRNESWGIAHSFVQNQYKSAWDLQQVIRHRLSWDAVGSPDKRKTGMLGVSYDDPLSCSNHPLATMESSADVTMINDLPEGFAMTRKKFGENQVWHLLRLGGENGREVEWVASGESAKSMVEKAKSI